MRASDKNNGLSTSGSLRRNGWREHLFHVWLALAVGKWSGGYILRADDRLQLSDGQPVGLTPRAARRGEHEQANLSTSANS